MAKHQENVKQHPEAELLTFENYWHSLSTSSNNTGHILKNKQKNQHVCIHEIMQVIIMKIKTKIKIDSHKCCINRLGVDMDTNTVNI